MGNINKQLIKTLSDYLGEAELAGKKPKKQRLTEAMKKAIDYIGRHRKSETKVGRDISAVTANRLFRAKYIMWLDEKKKLVMLTYNGERVFTKLHPHSKYRIK
jgi:hypothetical protein